MAPNPTTERVPTRRSAPILVALAAIGLTAVLVARPWDAAPHATPRAAAVDARDPAATRSHAQATALPSASSSPTPMPTPRPLPSPDLATPGPIGEFSLSFSRDGYTATCSYGRARRGVRHMTAMEVQPPIVVVRNRREEVADIRRVSWFFEIEAVRQEQLFDGEWETLAGSRRQGAAVVSGDPVRFAPLSLDFDGRSVGRSAVLRARLTVEWYTRNFELAGRAELTAHSYAEGNPQRADEPRSHCRAIIR